MKLKYGILLGLNFLLISCASKPQKISSPLFNQQEVSPSENGPVVTIPQVKSFEILETKKKQEAALQQNTDFITYTAKGGEQLSFVARSLLGNPNKIQRLLDWNPDLKKGPLDKGTQVMVKVDELNPIARYLSKDLLEKNSEKLQKSFGEFKKVTSYEAAQGDTLQKISNHFYKTTRNWTLLYLFNMKSISNPDKLEVGTQIKVPHLEVNSQSRRNTK